MSDLAIELQENFRSVRERIVRAAETAKRAPNEITLIAVSKTRPAEYIRAAYALGQRDFGENYMQELHAKREALRDLADLRWHLIGHLQTNKARDAVQDAQVLHSVDSERLAKELEKRASAQNRSVSVLVQVNVGGEEQKSGCAPQELPGILAVLRTCKQLQLRGLMTVPPHTEDPEGARPYFEHLRRLRDDNGGSAVLPDLSMGMTHDLEVAIATGATLVRVGTALFGSR